MRTLLERVRRHWADPQSQHRKVAHGFLLVSLFVLVGKLAGAAKEMTIAWRYGISATVDAYVFVFNLVNWPVSVWFSVISVVLIPLIARLRSHDATQLPRFRAELLGLTLLISGGLWLLCWLGLPALLRSGWLGLSGQALNEGLRMVGGLALLAPFGVLISLFSATLLAAGRHRNTLFEGIPALVLLIFLLLPPAWMPEPLLWGTLAGVALHAAALAAPLRRYGELPLPVFTQHSPAWQSFWGSIGIMAVGQLLMSFTGLLDQFFAAKLGVGALSTLSYANRILALVIGLGATAVSRATLPVFSIMAAQNDGGASRFALHWAKLMFVLGMAVLCVGWVCAPWVVELLFQRGAFTPEDTAIVVDALRFGILQLPFYFFALTLVSLSASRKRYIVLFISAVIGLLVKLVSATILVEAMQVRGLLLSTSLVYFINGIFFYIYTLRASND